MNYSNNGKVFVEWEYHSRLDDGTIDKWHHWKRMTLKRAMKENRRIITCSFCKKPAISLSHYWPYMGPNHCEDHEKKAQKYG
jgi:hypothetical protein